MKNSASEIDRTGIFRRRSAVLIAVLFMLTLLLSACGKNAPQPVPTTVPHGRRFESGRDHRELGSVDLEENQITVYLEVFSLRFDDFSRYSLRDFPRSDHGKSAPGSYSCRRSSQKAGRTKPPVLLTP